MARLIAVTGANRGYGRALAVELSKAWKDADLLLSHRAGSAMDDTLAEVKAGGSAGGVSLWEIDMSAPAPALAESTRKAFGAALGAKRYEAVLMIHNAGSLGSLDKRAAELDPQDIADNLHVNVTAMGVVNSAFLSVALGHDTKPKVTVVNVTSLCGIQAFDGFFSYCTGKAAREMMLLVAAKDHPEIRALNYSPGPMLTDMNHVIRETHLNPGTRQFYGTMVEEKTIVDPHASARLLHQLLTEDKFEQGAHLDYYDEIKGREHLEKQ